MQSEKKLPGSAEPAPLKPPPVWPVSAGLGLQIHGSQNSDLSTFLVLAVLMAVIYSYPTSSPLQAIICKLLARGNSIISSEATGINLAWAFSAWCNHLVNVIISLFSPSSPPVRYSVCRRTIGHLHAFTINLLHYLSMTLFLCPGHPLQVSVSWLVFNLYLPASSPRPQQLLFFYEY